MAGIYIHIPFCRQKCYYCDFYKTVNTSRISKFLDALKREIHERKNYINSIPVETIYLGGGTPSVLKAKELDEILNLIHKKFVVANDSEITLEANPDDLSEDYLKEIYRLGINRLSVGVQSFKDKYLQAMNRRHNSKQAINCVENAVNTGFSNISLDLIYGLPGLKNEDWKYNLDQVFQLPVQHLSAYHLTYHDGTAFYAWLKKGSLKQLDEDDSISQFEMLIEQTQNNGFEQYEISNFAKNKMYSKHNSAYWLGKKYLGLGPSSHSFNGSSRQWNISHVEGYVSAFEQNKSYFEQEVLTENDKFNEYILTRIRTIWGVSKQEIEGNYGEDKASYFLNTVQKYLISKLVIQRSDVFTLSKKGMFVSDEIMTDLMII